MYLKVLFWGHEGQILQSTAEEELKRKGMGWGEERETICTGETGQAHSLKRHVWFLLVGFVPPAQQLLRIAEKSSDKQECFGKQLKY